MKRIKLLLAAMMVFGPMAANADIIVTVNGVKYDVSITARDSAWDLRTVLSAQDWWGNQALAKQMSDAVMNHFGWINPIDDTNGRDSDNWSAYFAYEIYCRENFCNRPNRNNVRLAAWKKDGKGGASTAIGARFASKNQYFATAVRVPEPGTLALLGLGLAGIGLARRQRKTAAA